MNYFAQLEGNRVINVVPAQSVADLDPQSVWVQTDPDGAFRKHFASIGYLYDSELDAFLPPKRYVSWVLNTQTWDWEPPIPKPHTEAFCLWNEDKLDWDLYYTPAETHNFQMQEIANFAKGLFDV